MLSIIIPTLNEEDYLPLALASIKSQQPAGFEVIVADAGSTDKTLEVARSFNCRIVEGGLPARGRNNGAKYAKGDILLFLDADVILPQGFLQKSVEEFEKRGLAIAGFNIVPINGKRIDKIIHYVFNKFKKLTQKTMPHVSMVIMAKKKFHDSIGGFPEDVKLAEDFQYGIEMAKVSKYGHIDQPFLLSMRRYEKDGRLTYIKYFLSALYMFFLGPVKSDIFKYRFNHYKKVK